MNHWSLMVNNNFKNKTMNKGFTLLELMIVVAIIAILASIAFPSYLDSVRKSRRAAVQSDLIEIASYMEQVYTATSSYAGATIAASGVSNDYYTITLPTKTVGTFTLKVVPSGSQAQDLCDEMTLSHTGAKTTTGTAGCW